MQQVDLVIPRGATFRAHLWTLLDRDRHPIRSTDNLDVVAKVRRYPGSDDVLHTFASHIVLLTLPDRYDGQPVAAAQLDEIPHDETAAFDWDRGVWDLQVNREDPIVGGAVTAPWVVSR